MPKEIKNVCVVVLGDIGRSPRMQYHSLSLAAQGYIVDIVGYCDSQPLQDIKNNPHIYLHYLLPYPNIKYCPRLLNYIFKTIWQILSLLFILLIIRKPDLILVQNPPAIPALLVCWFYTLVIRAKLVIDWHNYAHTIMALNVGRKNILVTLTEKIEFFIGRKANNLCVTKAMRKDLAARAITAEVLYDRPPEMFCPISLQEKHKLLIHLGKKQPQFLTNKNNGSTIFTYIDEVGNVKLKENRPGFIISSTSWTEDEDFSILLSALKVYENHHKTGNVFNLPNLICVITGKGPLKEFYCNEIAKIYWKHVCIILPWLESCDYPRLLASADLGICLHTSSSGLDLPMKVVDMFGCGLPVCAYKFECLDELVQHEINSWVFRNSNELASQIMRRFQKFPNDLEVNQIDQQFKSELKIFQNLRWKENWKQCVLPLLR